MATLDLGKQKDGTPNRIQLRCAKTERNNAKRAGMGTARWNKSKSAWTFPIDPLVLQGLLEEFGESLILTPELEAYLTGLRNHQKEVLEYTEHGEQIHPDLLPYQQASARFLIKNEHGILALDMGLGKTVVASAALNFIQAKKILVICPNIIKISWYKHLLEWAGRKSYVVDTGRITGFDTILYGDQEKRSTGLRRALEQESYSIVLNFEQYRIHQDIFKEFSYDVVIIDEAHRICNRKTQIAEAVRATVAKTKYIWLLTGTPISNFYTDIWTLLNVLHPYRFSSYWNFVNIYMYTAENFFGGTDILGVKDLETFNMVLAKFIYGKKKAEVLPELPPKVYLDYPHTMTTTQQSLYEEIEKAVVSDLTDLTKEMSLEKALTIPNVITQIIRLRQVCSSPEVIGGTKESGRVDALRDLFEDLGSSGKQFLIYTSFRPFLEIISRLLNEAGIYHELIHGGQTTSHRIAIEEALNKGNIQAIGGMITAMGESMNLGAADEVIFANKEWSNRANVQAENRVHRMNITNSKNIITLYTPGTIEEDIIRACDQKQQIFDSTIGQLNLVQETILNLMQRKGK